MMFKDLMNKWLDSFTRGFQLVLNIYDSDTLKDEEAHPENYTWTCLKCGTTYITIEKAKGCCDDNEYSLL